MTTDYRAGATITPDTIPAGNWRESTVGRICEVCAAPIEGRVLRCPPCLEAQESGGGVRECMYCWNSPRNYPARPVVEELLPRYGAHVHQVCLDKALSATMPGREPCAVHGYTCRWDTPICGDD